MTIGCHRAADSRSGSPARDGSNCKAQLTGLVALAPAEAFSDPERPVPTPLAHPSGKLAGNLQLCKSLGFMVADQK
jgi:hypothetical protein